MEVDRALASFPVFQKTATNLLYSTTDGLRRTLDFNNPFGGLGEHVLGCDHTSARCVLDGLDLETVAADDASHEVVRDESGREVGARASGVGVAHTCRDWTAVYETVEQNWDEWQEYWEGVSGEAVVA